MDQSFSHRPVMIPHQAVKSLENVFPSSTLGKLPSLLNLITARRREEGGRVKQKLGTQKLRTQKSSRKEATAKERKDKSNESSFQWDFLTPT